MRLNILISSLIIALNFSCSTAPQNEHEHYLVIKAAMARDQYSFAANETIIFKKKYPQSEYLCELLPILTAYQKDRGYEVQEKDQVYILKCNQK